MFTHSKECQVYSDFWPTYTYSLNLTMYQMEQNVIMLSSTIEKL